MKKFSIAIHGGAGTILRENLSKEKEKEYLSTLTHSLNAAIDILSSGGKALDAVEIAVKILEDSHLFNAGKGSVFTSDGNHEMDASIMCGNTLNAGAVAGVRGVKNPVTLSRKVMSESDFVFLAGEGAEIFGKEKGIEFRDKDYFYDQYRFEQWQDLLGTESVQLDHTKEKKFGTVGAVALDLHGNLAAATSTGGLTNKKYGRIGDSSIIGAGNYANNKTCAISCTGFGEYFIRAVTAYDISCLMEYKGLTLKEATKIVVHEKLVNMGAEGGLIAVDKDGNVDLAFNSEGMYRGAFSSESGITNVKIYKD
jgi:L-asparaginase / beta-aspartyl-peptidase